MRLRGLLEGLLTSFSSAAAQALYLDDLFNFFEAQPEILSPKDALPFPVPVRHGFLCLRMLASATRGQNGGRYVG